MPLCSQAQGLETLQEKEGTKGIQRRANITEKFSADFNGKRSSTESLAELQTMVTLRRLSESREFSGLCPVEFTCKIMVINEEPNEWRWTDSPESIITPAMVVPWPPIHFVALCTIQRKTMSAR